MADDDKIKLGIALDYEAIRREAGQAGSVIGQELGAAINKAIASALQGQVLGSGMAPTMMAGSPSQGKDSLKSVVDALHVLHTDLVMGFGLMTAGPAGPGTGTPGFGGGGGGGAPQPKQQPKQQSAWGELGGVIGAADRVASAIFKPSFWNYMQTGGAGFSEQKYVADLLGNVPILNSMVAAPMQQGIAGSERLANTGYDLYRRYGGDAFKTYKGAVGEASAFTGKGDEARYFSTLMGQYHLDDAELADIIKQAAGYGSSQQVRGLAALQGRFGLGAEGAGYMGALMRGGGFQSGQAGAGKDQMHDFAEVLAIGVSTGLDRSRWPEVFESLTAAVKAQPGDVSKAGMTTMMDFIGSMGERYKGMGAGTTSAIGMFTGMMTGQMGALSNVFALQAAGVGGDKSYTEALMDVETGALNTPEGQQRVMERWMDIPAVKRYVATGEGLSQAYMMIRRLMPTAKPADIKAMLETLRRRGLPSGPSSMVTKDFQQKMDEESILPGTVEAGVRTERVKQSTLGAGMLGDTPTERTMTTRWSQGKSVSQVDPKFQGGDTNRALGEFGFSITSDTDAMRATKGEGGAYKSGPRAHDAQDLTGPPGSPVYTPVAGTAGAWFQVPGQNMGWGVSLNGDNGIYYRFLHLEAPTKSIISGKRYPAGTQIGVTAKHDLGSSASHLHLEAWKNRQAWEAHYAAVQAGRPDPEAPLKAVESLGVAGVRALLGGEVEGGQRVGNKYYRPGEDLADPAAGRIIIEVHDLHGGVKIKAKQAGKTARQVTTKKK